MDAKEVIFESRTRVPSPARLLRLPDPITIAAAAGFVAALIHAVVVREHLAHWWGYGAFFAGLAVAQAVAAIMIARRPGRRLFIAIVVGNAAVLALWVLSRSLGTSFLGPHAGHPEAIRLIDLAAAAAEVAQIIVLVPLLRRFSGSARLINGPRWTAAALIVVATVGYAAPTGPVHADAPVDAIELLAAGSEEVQELHEDRHLERLIAAPASTPEEEPVAEETVPGACTPRLADGIGVPPEGPDGEARAIVYMHESDLYMAAPPDGKVTPLTTDESVCWESTVAFKNNETITYQVDGTIYDVDLRSGTLHKVLTVPGLWAFAWNDDGTMLAYVTWGSEDTPPHLAIYTPATGATRRLRTFEEGGGRCGSMDDEISITWSPDGQSVLVVATIFDFADRTMFAVDLSGKNIIMPRMGTHALWGSTSGTIIYREFSDKRRWFSLELDTGHSTLLPMEPGTHRAAMSPGGRMIAYSSESENPSLYVFDLNTKTERVLTRGYATPLWISSDRLVATLTKPCSEEECGGHGEWMIDHKTAVFDLSGTKIEDLSVTSTMDADVLL